MLFIDLTLIAAALLGVAKTSPASTVNLVRDDNNPNLTQIICKPQMFREARKDFTQGNIAYLRRKADRPPITLGANTNGKQCTRVSCQYASGIYVCNDNNHDVHVALGTLADYAQAVLDDPREECNWHEEYYEGGGDAEDVTWGQAFDAGGWNVIVGMWHSDDKCP